MAAQYSVVCVCFFIHSSAGGHLGCFRISAIINNIAVKVGYRYLLEFMLFFFLEKYPGAELLDHRVVLILAFSGGFTLFSILVQWLYQFTFPQTAHKGSLLSTASPTLVISYLFDGSHPNRCEVISNCSFDLCFPYIFEHLSMYLLAICMSSLENVYSDPLSLF